MNDDSAPRGSILFLGDSLTAAGDWPAWFPEHSVLNRGEDGATTDQLVASLDAVVEAHPDAIALLIGTNDLAMRKSVEHLVRNIEYALVAIRRDLPGVRMLLQSILPRGREFADSIRDANRHLRQFAPTVRAQYLDLWPTFAQDDGEINPEFSDDRLRLNERGYEAWLGELRPAIDRLDDAPPMSGAISIVRPQQHG
jgi:lysophospholipase L1-like esterase